MNNGNDFYRFFGELVFSSEKKPWLTVSADQFGTFCAQAEREGLAPLLFRYVKNDLPAEYRKKFQWAYQKEAMKRTIESISLKKTLALFEQEKIPYVRIKGCDLAFRVYPDPVLRSHGDWDILFRKEDCPRVLALLQENGWKTFTGYAPDKDADHHYARMYLDQQSIEVHWNLPFFGSAQPEEIWEETLAAGPGCNRILTPEMNLLLISAHASTGDYSHLPVQRILLDTAFILLHDKVNWEKVHELADRWGILRPDILAGAWSEFFPDDTLPSGAQQREQQKFVRETFEMRCVLESATDRERSLNSTSTFDTKWFLWKLDYYKHPEHVCSRYHLKPGSRIKIVLYSLYDLFSKFKYFLLHAGKKDPVLQEYYERVRKINEMVLNNKTNTK